MAGFCQVLQRDAVYARAAAHRRPVPHLREHLRANTGAGRASPGAPAAAAARAAPASRAAAAAAPAGSGAGSGSGSARPAAAAGSALSLVAGVRSQRPLRLPNSGRRGGLWRLLRWAQARLGEPLAAWRARHDPIGQRQRGGPLRCRGAPRSRRAVRPRPLPERDRPSAHDQCW